MGGRALVSKAEAGDFRHTARDGDYPRIVLSIPNNLLNTLIQAISPKGISEVVRPPCEG